MNYIETSNMFIAQHTVDENNLIIKVEVLVMLEPAIDIERFKRRLGMKVMEYRPSAYTINPIEGGWHTGDPIAHVYPVHSVEVYE